jgi:hypothetical protein
MKLLTLSTLILAGATFATLAWAQSDEEALSRDCNKIYRKLCKDIPAGPEMLGKCYEKHTNLDSRIPENCTADFQTNIENYNEAKSSGQ